MLTPIDVHYLVGLLSRNIEGALVDVMLGDMVYDVAKNGKRDVDITVKDKSGVITVYKGIEVKAFIKAKKLRPLSSDIVDGLIRKLQDMPEITHKAIVSATGYTAGAVNKANYHGVNLYEFKTFEGDLDGDHIKMTFGAENNQFINNVYYWIGNIQLVINPKESLSEDLVEKIKKSKQFIGRDGHILKKCPTLDLFLKNIKDYSLNKIIQDETIVKPPIGTPFVVDQIITTHDQPLVYIEGADPVTIKEIRVTGRVNSEQRICVPQFKALFRQGMKDPDIVSMLFEDANRNLHGISIPKHGNIISALHVPLSDRLKNQIRQQKI
ncbi:MAG: hypothetical protein WC843_06730 [Candidatus Gracilibacteria bacterium]|jgi:hypothetical protein